jgi:hypothetical protein
MVKNLQQYKEPIAWGYCCSHIGKLIWMAQAITHVVGFLHLTTGIIIQMQIKKYEHYKKCF